MLIIFLIARCSIHVSQMHANISSIFISIFYYVMIGLWVRWLWSYQTKRTDYAYIIPIFCECTTCQSHQHNHMVASYFFMLIKPTWPDMIQEVNGVYQIMGKEQDLRRNRPTWWDCRWLTHMALKRKELANDWGAGLWWQS